MGESYSALGKYFEYLNDDCDYEKWTQYLLQLLNDIPQGSFGVDLGCGNGYFTRSFAKAGYKMTGVDISQQMLTRAEELTRREKLKIPYILADATKLKLTQKVQFITAINDCINYIPQAKIEKTFKKVYANLERGGKFVFDISTEWKIKNVLANNTFCEDREQIAYMWFNELFCDHIKMSLTFFEKGENGLYTRCDEEHIQYIHTDEEIKNALQVSGFEQIETFGHFGSTKERIVFLAKKL